MRHRKQGRKLNRTSAHRKAMLRNMACDLLLAAAKEDQPRRVTTTIPKAKEARRVAERAITLGKEATLHARRRALALLGSKRAVKVLFEDIAPLYNDRNGGYTRIVRLAKSRLGDGTDLCYLELVAEAVTAKPEAGEPVAPRPAGAPPEVPAAPPPAAETKSPASAGEPSEKPAEAGEEPPEAEGGAKD
jgi:large subunit ribosomal protein L17